MKKCTLFVMLIAAAAIAPALTVPANAAEHKHVSDAEKQASDALMSDAIGQLQAAAGNSDPAGPISAAISDMKQARPIYHGWRVKAIGSADRALKALGKKKSQSEEPGLINQAISDAQTALSYSSHDLDGR